MRFFIISLLFILSSVSLQAQQNNAEQRGPKLDKEQRFALIVNELALSEERAATLKPIFYEQWQAQEDRMQKMREKRNEQAKKARKQRRQQLNENQEHSKAFQARLAEHLSEQEIAKLDSMRVAHREAMGGKAAKEDKSKKSKKGQKNRPE